MQTIEQAFEEFKQRVYTGHPMTPDQELQLKNSFFAGTLQMFNSMNELGDLEEHKVMVQLDSFVSQMEDHFDTSVKEMVSTVTATPDADISNEVEIEAISPVGSSSTDFDFKLQTNNAVKELVHIYKEYADSPMDQSTKFVEALNVRVTVFCSALRAILGPSQVEIYLLELSGETGEISFSQHTHEEMAAMRESSGQTAH